jgi:hypothetical protein
MLAAYLVQVSCVVYLLTLKLEVMCSSETLVGFHSIISQHIERFIAAIMRISNSYAFLLKYVVFYVLIVCASSDVCCLCCYVIIISQVYSALILCDYWD